MTDPAGGRVRVGPARPEDVEALAELERAAFPEDAWTADYLRVAVDGGMPTVRVRAARPAGPLDGPVAGYAIASIVYEVAELQRIAVAPAYRRRGVARALVADVAALAAADGAEHLLLEVAEHNHGARALYAALGFAEIDRRERYYRDGSTAVVLALVVSHVPGP